MSEEIARIETRIYEATGAQLPHVLHDFVRFEVLGAPCHVRTDPRGEMLYLHTANRDFVVSILDLAATAAMAVDGHIKGEIRAKVLRDFPVPPIRPRAAVQVLGVVEEDGFITMYPDMKR